MTRPEDDAKPAVSDERPWMEEARMAAAQCWCDPETSDRVMDTTLAEAVARRIAAWMETGAQHARNETYWRERAETAERELAALRSAREAAPVAGEVGLSLTEVREFLGWLSVEIPELHKVEVPRLADALQKFMLAAPPIRQSAAPEGWKLVPVEPTEEMVDAAAEAFGEAREAASPHSAERSVGHLLTVAYKAALAAAPERGGQ